MQDLPMHLDTKTYRIPSYGDVSRAQKECYAVSGDINNFVEPGSGLRMVLDHWYVLSDSGHFYTDQAFDSEAAAVHWWRTEGAEQHEIPRSILGFAPSISIPTFLGGKAGWEDSGVPRIIYSNHLLEYWLDDDPKHLHEVQI